MKLFRNIATILTVAACAATSFADTASRYIQDGLLACWDGYENAGVGVHDPSATKWKDLVGGYEFTLTGVTVGDDRMVFAGTQSSYGTLDATGTAATFDKAKSGTLEIVYASATGTGSQVILQSSSTSGIAIGILNATKLIDCNASSKMVLFTSGTATNGVSLRYSSAKFSSAFANGSTATLDGSNNNWGDSTAVTTIGTRTSKKTYPFNGAIYCIRVYDRQLTSEEIAFNHALDVVRFMEGDRNMLSGILFVDGAPANFDTPSPNYGVTSQVAAGATISVSCPEVWTNAAGTTAATCTGWKLYDIDDNVVSSGAGRSFNYVHPDPAEYRRLEWQWAREYKISVSAGAGGSVLLAEQWFADGATVSVTATPDAGYVFAKWAGDLPTGVDATDPAPSFTIGQPYDIVAIFAPEGDGFVEYVESTNVTTYIDTGIVPSAANTRMVVTLAPMLVDNTTAACFGARSSTTDADKTATYVLLVGGKFRLDWMGSTSASATGPQPTVGTQYTFDAVYNRCWVNNSFYRIQSSNYKNGTTTKSLYLFAMNNNGALKNGMMQRLYGARIYSNGTTLSANYVPCVKDGVAGLYDTVSGTTLFPQNFPLVAATAAHPSMRLNNGVVEAKLTVAAGEGVSVAQAGESWVPAGSTVTLSSATQGGAQTEWTTTHDGLKHPQVYAGDTFTFTMPAFGASVTANASGAGDCAPFISDLNPIVAAAQPGDTIHLAEGTYFLSKQINLNKAITIEGAGIDRTFIAAQRWAYIRGLNISSSGATLKNLTVTGFTNENYGAGVYMSAGTIDTVRVTANQNRRYNLYSGAGIYMTGGTVTNSLIENNSMQSSYGNVNGVGIYMSGGTVVDSEILKNWRSRTQHYGTGIYIDGSASALVLRCRISGNNSDGNKSNDTRGMGLYIANSKAVVDRCQIVSNGIHGVYMTKGTLRNSLVWGHKTTSSSYDAGVTMTGGYLYNNTITANSSPSSFEGLNMSGGTAVNNIVFGNSGGGGDVQATGGTFNTNIVSSLTLVTTSTATGNLMSDPVFTSPEAGDFSIGFSSPAYNNGATIASVTEDYAGTERPQSGAYDIGAYEYVPPAGAALTAAIVIGQNDYRHDQEASATARVTGGSGTYTYEWYLDGSLVAGQTSDTFAASGMTSGRHDLRVVVSDGETTVTNDFADAFVMHPVEVYVSQTGSATFPYDTPATATTSPNDAFDALWLASDTTCVVHVAEGTYTVTTEINLSKPCRIEGAGREATVISGAGMSTAYRALRLSTSKAVVRNLTVKDCRNNQTGCAIYMLAGLLENVRSTANESGLGSSSTAPASGVGLYMEGGTATNCLIDCNSQRSSYGDGKGIGVYITSGLLVDCVVTNNWRDRYQTYGAGVYATGGTVRRCDIRDNSNKSGGSSQTAGMGVCLNGSGALVENCLIQNNGKQGVYLQSGTLLNCLVTGHKTAGSDYAGGVYMTGGKLYNCTVADNKCNTAAYNDLRMTAGTAKNTIATIATVAGGTTANCLLNADALFRRPESGDYRLTLGSPARDTGDNSVWDGIADPVDLAGNPRIITRRNGIVDMGCYELQPPAATVLLLW